MNEIPVVVYTANGMQEVGGARLRAWLHLWNPPVMPPQSTNNVDENIDWDRLLSCPNITSRRKRRQRPRANAYVEEEDIIPVNLDFK